MEAAKNAIPLGRVATADEIARWVLLLAGPHAGFMTGESVVLSGGDVMR
jgi:3-oxoacyl-[acyl-carrier protein] reductase